LNILVVGRVLLLKFGKNFKPVTGMGFLMGLDIFYGFGLGMVKSDGFVPVVIHLRKDT